jgi:hypothetical protein
MPNAAGAKYTGFKKNVASGRLEVYYRGTLVAQVNATDFGMVGAVATTSLTSTTTIISGTSTSSTTTMTAGTGVTVTAGDATVAAGDVRNTAGNLRLGVVSTFGMTEPVSAAVMKVGTNPAGAIATSGGVFVTTGGATISKIIADGTVNTIQT